MTNRIPASMSIGDVDGYVLMEFDQPYTSLALSPKAARFTAELLLELANRLDPPPKPN